MNYELAKELKDAGFPISPTFKCINNEPHLVCSENDGIERHSCQMVVDREPSLAELIEACIFQNHMTYFGLEMHSHDWRAGDLGTGGLINHASGKTPEEAVARLWLALNKK